MKTIILILIFRILSLLNDVQPYEDIAFECCPVLFSTDNIDISYDPKYYSLFFDPIQLDKINEKIKVESKIEIDYLEVISENNQKLHLKIEAKSLILDQDIFSHKDSKLIFHFKADHRMFDMYWKFK